MPEVLSALIIGCGDIAGGYDEAGDERAVRTHAGAYRAHPNFCVTACIDPDDQRRQQFMAFWDISDGYPDIESCRQAGLGFDVASVCLPTDLHGDVLEDLLEMPIRAVFAEKPMTNDLVQSTRIVNAYADADRLLVVNYLRRFDGEIQSLKREIADGVWGALQSGSAHYAKGIFNCGSHAIDLLQFLFGPMRPVAVRRCLEDYQPDDPTLTAQLESEDGAVLDLIGCDSRLFFPFEIDLVMEKGRISLEDLGLKLRRRRVAQHPSYVHQTALDDGEWMDTEMPHAMENAVACIYEALINSAPLVSSGVTALASEKICAELKDMAVRDNRGVPV
ncbi:MAG: Gfo/Idh/MocA family oxidoreductase [Rhodospirillaceae bacterium]|jgi:predicted dehydrogenase|nr:Gfo/Idh/MocA family oxidoreductase [Rhodospirillaceae bacterium]MBT3910849.1 Gfo/Idh/MocA family oxidoreductase [Rhodospirillaceae bacterium]MBT5513847.1 Gfo/Idh/MocA family oxidoreductase [Rhodospirillaceae bacterium]MBT6085849.1 Gfo/Idh/MocA family oxidoreductase [Rhodospirillaceae bacterium]MBT6883886.1 Gfo/Idh/MocA family oxidoreductase [Rhodospirillaceae bacterium]